jgi:hypothetical protein
MTNIFMRHFLLRFYHKRDRSEKEVRASAFAFQTLKTTKILKNFYHKGAQRRIRMQEVVLFSFLLRLIRLRGGYFLQELYDFEKIMTVKKVNVDALINS